MQRVGEVVLEVSESNWYMLEAYRSFYIKINDVKPLQHVKNNKGNIISDLYIPFDGNDSKSSFITTDWQNTAIRVKDSSILTVNDFKAKLKQNPMTVQYELAEPIITKLDPQTLLAYEDGTINLSSDT